MCLFHVNTQTASLITSLVPAWPLFQAYTAILLNISIRWLAESVVPGTTLRYVILTAKLMPLSLVADTGYVDTLTKALKFLLTASIYTMVWVIHFGPTAHAIKLPTEFLTKITRSSAF